MIMSVIICGQQSKEQHQTGTGNGELGVGWGRGGICRMNPKKNILPFDTVICNLTVERLSPRENPALAA